MDRTIATVEMSDGQSFTARVTIHAKIAWEKAAKANKWNVSDNTFTATLFWAWHATARAGHHSLSFTDFEKQVADVDLDTDEGDQGDDGDTDPTQTAPTTEPQ